MKKILLLFLVLVFISILLAEPVVLRIKSFKDKWLDNKYVLTGDVYINRENEVTVTTENATLTKENGEWTDLTTLQDTHIVFESGNASSLLLDYIFDSMTGTMTQNIECNINVRNDDGTIDPDGKVIVNNADILYFDLNEDYFLGWITEESSPKISINFKDEMDMVADYFEYFNEEGKVIMKGNVFVDDKKNSRTVKGEEVYYDVDKDEFTGIKTLIEFYVD